MSKSFYDLDYIIEVNEKALEQYNTEYNRVLDKYAVTIIIYSALSIYIVPLCQHIIDHEFGWGYCISFVIFLLLFVSSLIYFIKLLLPVTIFYRGQPAEFYKAYRLDYESQMGSNASKEDIDRLLKGTYINELEAAIDNNEGMLIKKQSFYYRRLILTLLSVFPYLTCLAFHIAQKEKVQKVEWVDHKFIKFDTTKNSDVKH